jgi:hypothetical protein
VMAARFVAGPIPEPPMPESADVRAAPVQATREHVEQGAELAREIEDEELREQVARAAAASLARAADGRSVW